MALSCNQLTIHSLCGGSLQGIGLNSLLRIQKGVGPFVGLGPQYTNSRPQTSELLEKPGAPIE